ncbi:MAG: phosphate/phosphite/phosphonate ABC transporter substrate-binding protein [Gammaproteobacteria bacterium]|nr:phosphate/phosphite/phosphonate ABC transporter substrate-binding protein [Gammaproteobacteria bacterium]
MNKRLIFTLILILLISFKPAISDVKEAKTNSTITMGIFPLVSSVALFKRFAPLKDYIADNLGYKISLETARDFPTFVRRTAEKKYDIVLTAPHFTVLAADSGNYKIIARPKLNLISIILVKKNSTITELSQLAGKEIATPPNSAIVTRSGKNFLKLQGLTDQKKPKYKDFKTHNAAYQSVLANKSNAAIVALNAVKRALDNDIPLRIIGKVPELPGMGVLVSTQLPEEFTNKLEKLLVSMEQSDEGRLVLKKIATPGYWSARIEDYESIRPYVPKMSQPKN